MVTSMKFPIFIRGFGIRFLFIKIVDLKNCFKIVYGNYNTSLLFKIGVEIENLAHTPKMGLFELVS